MNSTTQSYKECHTGNVKVFEYGKGTLYASGWTHGMQAHRGAIMIDLTGNSYNEKSSGNAVGDIGVMDAASRSFFGSFLEQAAPKKAPVYWLKLFIPDMQIPTWDDSVWTKLADFLREKMTEGFDVIIGCLGGHGRTGIAVSILAQLMVPELTGEDPILWLREVYCSHVVETATQVEYVYKIIGEPTTGKHAEPSKKSVVISSVGDYKREREPEQDECVVCLKKLAADEHADVCQSCYKTQKQGFNKRYASPLPCKCLIDGEKYQALGDNKLICDEHMIQIGGFYGDELVAEDIKKGLPNGDFSPNMGTVNKAISNLKGNKLEDYIENGMVTKGVPSDDTTTTGTPGIMYFPNNQGATQMKLPSTEGVCLACGQLYHFNHGKCTCGGTIYPKNRIKKSGL